MDSARALGTTMGVIRTGVGAALLAAPRWAGRVWVGPGGDGPGSLVLARAVGARDVVLGASTLAAVRSRRETVGLLRLGVLADAADVAATLIAWPHLDARRRVVMPAVAAAVGLAGVAAVRVATRPEPVPTLSGEVRSTIAPDRDVDRGAVDRVRV